MVVFLQLQKVLEVYEPAKARTLSSSLPLSSGVEKNLPAEVESLSTSMEHAEKGEVGKSEQTPVASARLCYDSNFQQDSMK